MKTNLLACLAIAVVALSVGTARPDPAQAQAQFTEQQLTAFVVAAVRVRDLVEEWAPRINEANDPEQAEALRAEANAALVAAIDQTDGITVEEYKSINEAARDDPALSTRIEEIYRSSVTE